MACHKVGEYSSGVLGPDLNTVFARRSEVWILKKLADPTLENTETVMPQMNLSAVDRASVVLYLRSVAKKK
jgi:cbb3-type cytochrome oxidase cytochrome c subunit